MDDLMLMEYLRNKGMDRDMSDNELIREFKEFMKHNKSRHYDRGYSMDEFRTHDSNEYFRPDKDSYEFINRFNKIPDNMNSDDIYAIMKMMKNKDSSNEHFNDSYARYIVSNMHHLENGRKYVGEKFDMTKAKEVLERYKGIIPSNVTHADVYVAINSQYHDYCELFKAWFGGDIDYKIIESAIIFWFKDVDYKDGFKLWNYFKEN